MANSLRKQEILEAAARLFRDRGYPATSMRHLAEEVQLKASSLYNHIGSKEEILKTICFDNARRFADGMTDVQANQELGAAGKIKALIRLHIQIATHDLTSVTAFNDEWRHLSEPHLSEFKKMRKNYENAFKDILTQGIEEGIFRSQNPTILLYSILSSFRWLYDWFKPERSIDSKQLEEEMTNLIMNGLLSNNPSE
ncbi:MAG: TetR/AcrR family transcriptional regulator [Saprospiraceae bacterium]|nr:TetR/AcrR family transcriptional regulator [Saprospiraceae bacterium]